MKSSVWLRVEGKKTYGSWKSGAVHVSKTKPGYKRNEVALNIQIEIPDAVFEEPVFIAKVELPEPRRALPGNATLAESVGTALSAQLGFKVYVEIPEPAQTANA